MKRVARLEPAPQKLPRLGLRRRAVHGHPFGGKAGGSLETPVRIDFCYSFADALVAQILEQPAADDLADLGLVVGDQIARDAADDLGDPVLPLPVPVGHLDLAARQTDDGRGPGGAGDRDREVLDEGVETLGHAAMAVDEVQDLVEQQQHRSIRGGEHPADRLRARRRGPRGGAQCRDALFTRQLARKIDPRRLPALRGVPGIADEDTDLDIGHLRHACLGQQIGNAGQPRRLGPGIGEVVERGERVGLAAAELGDQGENRRRVLSPAGEAPEHHADVLLQGAREAGAGEELRRVAVVLGRGPGNDLLEGDREFVGAE